MEVQHSWCVVLSTNTQQDEYRAIKFVMAMGLLLNMMFVNTILFSYFNDNGSCEAYTFQDDCLASPGLDQYFLPIPMTSHDTLCSWDTIKGACSYNVNFSSVSAVVVTIIITVLSLPLNVLVMYFCNQLHTYLLVTSGISQLVAEEMAASNENTDDKVINELAVWQTKSGTLLRAAKLKIMQAKMDDVEPEAEAKALKHLIDEGLVLAVSRPREVLHPGYRNKLSHILKASVTTKNLTKKIVRARNSADDICTKLSYLDSKAEREGYLMQQFALSLLAYHRRRMASRFYSEPVEKSEDDRREEEEGLEKQKDVEISIVTVLSLVMLPIYFIGLCVFIFLSGVQLGDHTAKKWLVGYFMSMVYSVLLLEPVTIFVNFVVLSTTANFEIQHLNSHLQKRAKLIMFRQNGLIHHAQDCSIQHLNPACRAARQYPELAVSRLLMSLNDADFPRYFPLGRFSSSLPHTVTSLLLAIEALVVLAITAFVVFPEPVQSKFMEVSCTLSVHVIVMMFTVGLKSHPPNLAQWGFWFLVVLLPAAFLLIAFEVYRVEAKEVELNLHEKSLYNTWEDVVELQPILRKPSYFLRRMTFRRTHPGAHYSEDALAASEEDEPLAIDIHIKSEPVAVPEPPALIGQNLCGN